MTLADYLTQHDLTHEGFARMIGCEQPTVSRFVAGARIPSPVLMRKIVEVTNGAVTANDFFGIEAAPAEGAEAQGE